MLNYKKQDFRSDQLLKAEHLNYIEDGVEQIFNSIEEMCPPLNLEDNLISCYPLEEISLNPKTYIEAAQAGEGDPSPDNIRDINGWNAATITRCGRNLLHNDVNKIQEIQMKNSSGADITRYGYILDLPAGNYVIKGEYKENNLSYEIYALVVKRKNKQHNGTQAINPISSGNLGKAIVFTIGQDEQLVVHSGVDTNIANSVTKLGNLNLYIYKDDGNIESVPYQGDTYTAQFPETFYEGYYDWSAGALVVTHEGKILDGTSEENNSYGYTWYSGGSGKTLYYAFAIGKKFTYNKGKIVCSHYPFAEINSNNVRQNYIHLANSATNLDIIAVRPNLTKYPDLESWQNFLKNNPITVAYELTVPKIIPLTPQNIPALSGLNNIWSNAEKVEIFGYANPLHIIEEQTATINNYETRIAALENAVLNNN